MVAVALVTSSFLPRFGGVEEHVLNLARRLTARGHRVVVWAVDQGDADVPTAVEAIPVRYLPCPLPARTPGAAARFGLRAPGALSAWHRALRADRPELLHVHCYGPNGVYAGALSQLARVPLVVSSHGETFGDADGAFDSSALLRGSLRRSLRRAAAVTGCSQHTVTDLQRRFGAGPARVVPNGIDLEEPAGNPPGWLPQQYVLGVGRLVHNKGFDLLLDAFARSRHRGASLIIGGDGPERAALRRRADEHGLGERVLLPGRLDRAQVVTLMARALAVVVPSRAEAFGITVLEGWRAGTPVIATSRGGPPEFVDDGRTGIIVDPTDVPALARALDRVLDDDHLAAAIGAAGRQRAGAFSWDSVARGYEELYAGVLG